MWYPNPAAARLQRGKQVRMLYACMGVSIALHGLAMVSFPNLRFADLPDDSPVLTALFASRSEDAVGTPIPEKRRERRPAAATAQPQKRVEPVPAERPVAGEPLSAQAPDPQPAPASEVASALSPAVPQEALANVSVVDSSLFDAYRLALIDAARRYKRYPVQAMERGWEGRVEVRVVVDAIGTIKSALVKSSSRYQILDNQALDMVRRAFKDLAEVRPAPRGREFTVDVPVIFELKTG